ncbi:MAG: hypothetical protein ACR2NP_06310, partial [Pirellulaceae bacterium]
MYLRFLGSGFAAAACLLVLFNILGNCETGTTSPLDGASIENPVFIPHYVETQETIAAKPEKPQAAAPTPAIEADIIKSTMEVEEPVSSGPMIEVPVSESSTIDESADEAQTEPIVVTPVAHTSLAMIQEVSVDETAPARSVIVSPQPAEPAVIAEPVLAFDFRMSHPAMFVRDHHLHYYRHLMR